MARWPHTDEALRTMYRGGRGDATARRYVRLWANVFALGLFPKRWVTLEVVGRNSGRVTRFPLGMADWQDQFFLVSMLGEDCNWVEKVRAAEGRVTLRRRRATRCRLVEIPADQRPPILRRYLQTVPGARPHIPVGSNAPLVDFEGLSARYPAFRVDRLPASELFAGH